MATKLPDEVKKKLEDACKDGDLTTVKSILSDHPDSIHAKFGYYGNIILTLKNSNHNYLALIKLNCLSIHNISIYLQCDHI